MEKLTGLKLADKIYSAFGACQDTNTIKAGLLASAAHAQLRSELVRILREAGTFYEEAIMTVNKAFQESEDTLTGAKPRLVDENIVMVSWKRESVCVSVCVCGHGCTRCIKVNG